MPSWDDIARVVDLALDAEPEHRAAILAGRCSGRPDLLRAAERLLCDIDRADGFLAGTAAQDAAPLLSWAERHDLAAGTRFGVYEILRPVGRGGMATVYLARDHKHHRQVAIKVLHHDIAAAVGREWFLREIEIAAALHHPHILPLHDSGAVDDRLYYVMPYVEGESLRQRLTREGTLPLAAARQILGEVAGALDYAHRQGVVHRDIKPENILLQDDQAVVADFGIARAIATGAVETGRADTIPAVGTPAYMSPEQAAGVGPLDGRTDVYALGCVAYEMLEGVPPFTGSTAEAILASHSADPVPSLRRGAPAVARAQEQVIQRALAKLPAERFATAGEFAQALGSGMAGGPAARSRRRWVAALLAIVVLLTAVVLRPSAPPAADPDVIAVTPFRSGAPGGAMHETAQRVSALLAARLAGDSGPRSAAPAAVAAAWRRLVPDGSVPSDAAVLETARRVGAGRVIEGSVAGAGQRLTLSATLRAATGRSLAQAEDAAPGDSLEAMVDRVATRLLAFGAGRDSARLAAALPVALPAIHAYLTARDAYWGGRTDEAGADLERALALDSTFALAALELLHVRPGGDETVTRIARTGRSRLLPADQTLLDIWTGPYLMGPERIERWQSVATSYPDRAEAWYGLGYAFFYHGLSAGVVDPFRYADEAFRRGWAIDSSEQVRRAPGARAPLVEEPLRHIIELAQMRGDTGEVIRLASRWLAGDSTSAAAWYLRWHLAIARGEAARRAFWSRESAIAPEAFGRIFEFVEGSGVGAADLARSAELDVRHWEASEPAAGLFERGMVALDLGRPIESGRLLAQNEHIGTPDPDARPRGWRLAEGGDAGVLNMALYWGGDSARGNAALGRLTALAAGPSTTGNRERDRLEAICGVGASHAAQGEWDYVATAAARLRGARARGLHDWDSASVARYTRLCALLLDAGRAIALHLPDARRKLDSADVAIRSFELPFPGLGANLVLAGLAERQGDLPMALRVLRRRAGIYQAFPSWYLSSYLREEGRVAALVGDTVGAIRADRHYLALRPDPEPEVRAEVERVRAHLAGLVRSVP